jgi:hypothetical protein
VITDVNPRHALIAACMMHVEGFYSTKSAAWKHNNPGNIMQPVAGQHGKFELRTYPTIQAGYEALVADVAANKGSTLGHFVAKYAPPTENDSLMYMTVVSNLTGIAINEKI